MAWITAWILSQNAGIPASKVITFASPKPGDGVFKSAYEARITQVCCENYQDVVPLLPARQRFPRRFPFKQVWDVVTEIGDQNFNSFVNAQSANCGEDYMTGACPGVCPQN